MFPQTLKPSSDACLKRAAKLKHFRLNRVLNEAVEKKTEVGSGKTEVGSELRKEVKQLRSKSESDVKKKIDIQKRGAKTSCFVI
jgi:hypothetical protein